jgi:Zn-dependent protease/CBS domain-containing protein
MAWSYQIARIFGIPVRVHLTFVLLIAWLAHSGLSRGDLTTLWVAVGMFCCVLAHELGHSVVAQRFGVRVADITLLPIGGVARMESIPRNPRQEFWIALAGPAVNFVVGPILYLIHRAIEGPSPGMPGVLWAPSGFVLGKLAAINLSLGLFNLLPAFPMDGGRILRAFLAQRMPYEQATQRAAALGQLVAFALAILGLTQPMPMLLFIALFVFIGAAEEGTRVQTHAIVEGVAVRDAMVRRFATLRRGDTLSTAVDLLLTGTQQDFPVVEGTDVVGILTRRRLLEALSQSGAGLYVSEVMEPAAIPVDPDAPLDEVLDELAGARITVIPVVGPDGLCGLITADNTAEFVLVRAALNRNRHRGER